jgi:hypothetical protein
MPRVVNDRLVAEFCRRAALARAQSAEAERRMAALQRRREALLREAKAIRADIEGLLPVSPRFGARAARLRLVDLLAILLDGRAMRVKEAAASVRRAGFPTPSAHLAVQVQMALVSSPQMN